MSMPVILIVEDDQALRDALTATIELAGYTVINADNGANALACMHQQSVDLVVSDVQMDTMSGHELLRQLGSDFPSLPVILMTAYGTIDMAVDAMRNGAVDYLVKPFNAEVVLEIIKRHLPLQLNTSSIIAVDEKTRHLAELARRVAATDATVMISGESGTGKEVFAQLIHDQSKRCSGPFIAINCAAIPENMLEASLFGYDKGAFTGAYQSRAGKFEKAQDGTLLLDEISEMDLGLQAKLLRVLQEKEVERLGGNSLISLNVRVIATTNRNMREEVAAGRFREDLFYRLNVFPLHLAPLRDRKKDILPLAERFIASHSLGQAMPQLTDDARHKLLSYGWPGNVRELDNAIQRALILLTGTALAAANLCFSPEIDTAQVPEKPVAESAAGKLGGNLMDHEFALILDALSEEKGRRKAAAEKLGISTRTLRNKLARMREHGIEIPV
ncbi:MAG: sigma-54 dependent transcriptional regulator [Gammaproteobacteria bacterium]